MSTSVQFSTQKCAQKSLGIITLNRPKNLNALNLEMIDLIRQQLREWAINDDIALILLQASGDRAFCAGGDVRVLAQALLDNPKAAIKGAGNYFAAEFELDYAIHCFAKPILCWGDHIVMGGGMGLMAGSSHRVVTERTQFSMPEIGIGYFPDVGASHFLNQMPGKSGLFLGITGKRFYGDDAVFLGFADYFIDSGRKEHILDLIAKEEWSDEIKLNKRFLTKILHRFEAQEITSRFAAHLPQIDLLLSQQTFAEVDRSLINFQTDDPWWQEALDLYQAGSPSSRALVFAQYHRANRLTLKENFLEEWKVAVNCALRPDFAEGIRALLIDKDKNPHWKPASTKGLAGMEDYFKLPSEFSENLLAARLEN